MFTFWQFKLKTFVFCLIGFVADQLSYTVKSQFLGCMMSASVFVQSGLHKKLKCFLIPGDFT